MYCLLNMYSVCAVHEEFCEDIIWYSMIGIQWYQQRLEGFVLCALFNRHG